jgi:hypothetical protein
VREVAAIFGLEGKLEAESRLLSQGEKKLSTSPAPSRWRRR